MSLTGPNQASSECWKNCQAQSMTATGANFLCPERDKNRKEPVSSLASCLPDSLYCPQLAEPHTETAGKGETLPQHHKSDCKRMGLILTDSILISRTPSSQSALTLVYFVMLSLWIIGVLK